jgi:membrane-associated phospholipid phosphatase
MVAAALLENQTAEGKKEGLLSHALDVALVTGAATEILKSVVREDRPNSENDGSFPSGHASFTFGLATVLAQDKPKQKWLWYLTAGAISWSRVALRAHHTRDVVAGALLGHFAADEILAYDRRNGGAFTVSLWHRSW